MLGEEGRKEGRKRPISGRAEERRRGRKRSLLPPLPRHDTREERRARRARAVVKEQGHGLPSLTSSKADKVDTATQLAIVLPATASLARSLAPHSAATKKRGTLLPPLSSPPPSPTPSPACPFVRQSDSPSVLRGLLPLPPFLLPSQSGGQRGRTSADGSAVSHLVHR